MDSGYPGGAKCAGTQTASAIGVIGPIRVFFKTLIAGDQKAFSLVFIAPPVHTFTGLPCLGSFSVVGHVRHIEGSPWLGSYSVVWHMSHLKEHPGWGPAL